MDVTRALLEWLTVSGPLTLGLVAFICALGMPLPVPLLMIAAGALVRQGQMHLPTAIAVTAGSALAAELTYYAIGRKFGPLVRTRAGVRFASAYDRAESQFNAQPSLTVYLTRWLLAPIGIPVNLVAGASRFPLTRFALAAIIGNTMWIVGYTAVGYGLGNEWQHASPVIDRYKVYFAGAALLIGLALLVWRKRDALGHAAATLAARRPAIKAVTIDAEKPPKP